MTEKPQNAQEDILDQIMGRDPAYSGQPPGAPDGAALEAPPTLEQGDVSSAGTDKTVPAPEKKNKRSAVYIYLLILFGAAFLMLLLAYFVQQRNNESTISNLRDSMNLSRTELMEQIAALEQENESLRLDNELHEYETNQAQDLCEELRQWSNELDDTLYDTKCLLYNTIILGNLERFCHEGDYLMAAAMVEKFDCFFNQHNSEYFVNRVVNPVQTARYMELREQILDKAGCMALEQFFPSEDSDKYTERPYIIPSDDHYDAGEVGTARSLCKILDWWYFYYPFEHPVVGLDLIIDFYLDGGNLDRLNGGDFQPSTMELLMQIIDALNTRRLLEKHEDGTVSFLVGNDQFITFTLDSGEVVQTDVPIDEVRERLIEWNGEDVSRETVGE